MKADVFRTGITKPITIGEIKDVALIQLAYIHKIFKVQFK